MISSWKKKYKLRLYTRGSRTRQVLRGVALSISLASTVPKASRWQKARTLWELLLYHLREHVVHLHGTQTAQVQPETLWPSLHLSAPAGTDSLCVTNRSFIIRMLLAFGDNVGFLFWGFCLFILIIISLKCCFSMFPNPGRVTVIHFVIMATVSSLPKVFPWFLIIQKPTASPWPNRGAHGVLSVLQMLQNLAEPPYGDLEKFPDGRIHLCHRERRTITQSMNGET